MNVVREMERLGIKSRAAAMLLSLGKVSLDDRVLTPADVKLPADECRGRMLTAHGRQVRLLGGQRHVEPPAQRQLPMVI